MKSYSVDRAKWSKMTFFEQMGNIYSEVGRSFDARQQGLDEKKELAVYRAIDLFDATIEDLKNKKSGRVKEVLIAKGHFLSNINDKTPDENDTASLDRYFLEFAIAARRNR
jgi:hypothetical protein